MADLVEHTRHPAPREPQFLGVDDERDHDLDVRSPAALEQVGRGRAQRPDLHLVEPAAHDAEPDAARADHRVRLVQTPHGPESARLLVESSLGEPRGRQVEQVGQELVQRWVEQPDRDGQPSIASSTALEVGDLGGSSSASAGGLGVGIGRSG